MLDRLAGHEYYCFLDGYSGYNQIAIAPKDQEKTTFTCPYGTFAFRRMPFGLCNAPGTFQRCIMAIFSDMVEKTIAIFMDNFSVLGNSFDNCLENLRSVLIRCEENLRFIKDFSQIAKPLSNLLVQGIPFEFDSQCLHAFSVLKDKLVSAPIVLAPNGPFRLNLCVTQVILRLGQCWGRNERKFSR